MGDLIIAPDGQILATSSSPSEPAIYVVNETSGTLDPWLVLPQMISLQGVTANPATNVLYVADYREGILKIDLATKTFLTIANQTDHPLKGIDGLYFAENGLIAIHNGLQPNRIVRYELNPSGDAITAFRYLDKALPAFGEPTLGTVVGNDLIYIANSPWGAYDREKALLPEKVSPPILMKTSVDR